MSNVEAVMYHYVHDEARFGGMYRRTLIEFSQQLDHLASLGTFVSREEFLNIDRLPAGHKKVLLTFDDGLRDHTDIVAPILKERGIFAVFFCPTLPLESRKILDVQKIQILIAALGDLNFVDFALQTVGGRLRNYISEKRASQQRFEKDYSVVAAKQFLQRDLGPERTVMVAKMFDSHFSKSKQQEIFKDLYATAEDLRTIQRQGFMIGNHSRSHPWLGHLNASEAIGEVLDSQKFLEAEIVDEGTPRVIAYPYGDSSQELELNLQVHNFRLGFSTIPGSILPKHIYSQPLSLPRWDTNDWKH